MPRPTPSEVAEKLLKQLEEARNEAESWRGKYVKVRATGSLDYERLMKEHKLPWEKKTRKRSK